MNVRLRRETLADQVAHHLVEFIVEQRLPPYAALPSEAALTREFKVSRPVVREALRSLAARGIIEIANGKGARVMPITSHLMREYFDRAVRFKHASLIELMEVRRGIEIQSALLAAQRRTPEDVAEVERVVAAMRQHLHDPQAYTALDVELHLLIASASGNTLLYHLVESIREPLRDTIREGLRRRGSVAEYERVQELHEHLVAALARGDPHEAARAMALHFDEAVMALVQDEGDVPIYRAEER
jgi:DNA-binding FadR family transcriptional regulator